MTTHILSLTLVVQGGAERSVGRPASPLQTVTGTPSQAPLCAALEARGSAHGHPVQGIFTASKPAVTTRFSPHPQLCDGQEGHREGKEIDKYLERDSWSLHTTSGEPPQPPPRKARSTLPREGNQSARGPVPYPRSLGGWGGGGGWKGAGGAQCSYMLNVGAVSTTHSRPSLSSQQSVFK